MTSSIDTLATPQNRFQARSNEPDAKGAANQLEAFFLRQMLAEMRSGMGEGLFGGGYAGKMFQDMLDDSMAEQMSGAGGLGIADMIEKELDEQSMPGANAMTRPTLAHFDQAARYQQTDAMLRVSPVDAEISSNFGGRIHPVTGEHSFHEGLDLAATRGSSVSATAWGVVIRAEKAGTYGNLVVVDHGGELETRYAHLDQIDVQVGQQVAAGQALGKVGSTGRTTGPHLHFEMRQDGKPLNPERELRNLVKNAAGAQEGPEAADR